MNTAPEVDSLATLLRFSNEYRIGARIVYDHLNFVFAAFTSQPGSRDVVRAYLHPEILTSQR